LIKRLGFYSYTSFFKKNKEYIERPILDTKCEEYKNNYKSQFQNLRPRPNQKQTNTKPYYNI